jgi:hypothetical protein
MRSRQSARISLLLALILDHENTPLRADSHQGDDIRDDLRKLGPVLLGTFASTSVPPPRNEEKSQSMRRLGPRVVTQHR